MGDRSEMQCAECMRLAVVGGYCWQHYTEQYPKSGVQVIETPGLKEGYEPPSASLQPPVITAYPEVCIADGCNRAPHSRGLCGRHYQEWRTTPTNYDPKFGLPERPKCEIPGCTGLLYAKERCQKHYLQTRPKRYERMEPLTDEQKRDVLQIVYEVVSILGPEDMVLGAEMNGRTVGLSLRFADGTERQCKLRIV